MLNFIAEHPGFAFLTLVVLLGWTAYMVELIIIHRETMAGKRKPDESGEVE